MRKLVRFIFLMIVTSLLTLVGVAGLVYTFRDRELPMQERLVPPVPVVDTTGVDTVMTPEKLAVVEDSLKQAAADSQANAVMMAEQQITRTLDSLNIIKTQIQQSLQIQGQYKQEQLAQLSTVFDAMRPDEAAGIIELLDDNIIASIMPTLDARQAARILGALPAPRAQEISEMMVQGP